MSSHGVQLDERDWAELFRFGDTIYPQRATSKVRLGGGLGQTMMEWSPMYVY